MREVIDKNTGAILFKSDPQDPTEMEIKRLNNKITDLELEISKLKDMLGKLIEDSKQCTCKTGQY